MSLLSFLESIKSNCKYTGCYKTNDFISGAITHKWTMDQMSDENFTSDPINIYSNKWFTIFPKLNNVLQYEGHYEHNFDSFDPNQTINLIKTSLHEYNILSFGLDSNDLDHSFIIFKEKDLYYIVDSYGSNNTQRLLDVRLFDLNLFHLFLIDPNVLLWNKLFLSNEGNDVKFKTIDLSCRYLKE